MFSGTVAAIESIHRRTLPGLSLMKRHKDTRNATGWDFRIRKAEGVGVESTSQRQVLLEQHQQNLRDHVENNKTHGLRASSLSRWKVVDLGWQRQGVPVNYVNTEQTHESITFWNWLRKTESYRRRSRANRLSGSLQDASVLILPNILSVSLWVRSIRAGLDLKSRSRPSALTAHSVLCPSAGCIWMRHSMWGMQRKEEIEVLQMSVYGIPFIKLMFSFKEVLAERNTAWGK